MSSTAWTIQTPTATSWNNSQSIPNLGATMNDTGYIMNDTVLTMGDYIQNPIFAASTAYTLQTLNATLWDNGSTPPPSGGGNAYGLLLAITQ